MPNPTLYDNFNQVRQYIDQNQVDLSSYVSKSELEGMSYATTSDLSNYLLSPTISGYEGQMKLYNDGFFEVTSSGDIRAKSFTYNQLNSWSAYTLINRNSLRNYVDGRIADIESTYATQTYVADYVAEHGGGGSTVIDENIIPKENNTYTLGDSSYLYSATYTSRVKVGNNSQMYNDGGGITFSVNNNNGIRIGGSTFYPKTNKGYSNGSSTNYWDSTYTYNLYAPTAYTDAVYVNTNNKIYNTAGGGMKVQRGGTDICAFLGGANLGISPVTNNTGSLGNTDQRWKNIYVNNAYISNYNNFIWTGTAAEYEALSDYTTYQLYLVKDE